VAFGGWQVHDGESNERVTVNLWGWRMRGKIIIAAACVLTLLACHQRSSRLQEDDLWQMGGALPDHGNSSLTSATWPTWANREWPKACTKLQMRFVIGTVPHQGRLCKLDEVAGIVPVSRMRAGGSLISNSGEQYRVGWKWADYNTTDEKKACAADPVGDKVDLYFLVRSEPHKLWRLSQPTKRPRLYHDSDEVFADCYRLYELLGRVGSR